MSSVLDSTFNSYYNKIHVGAVLVLVLIRGVLYYTKVVRAVSHYIAKSPIF